MGQSYLDYLVFEFQMRFMQFLDYSISAVCLLTLVGVFIYSLCERNRAINLRQEAVRKAMEPYKKGFRK